MQEIHNLGKMIGHTSVLFRRHLDQAIAGASGDDTGVISGRNFWILRYLEDHRGEDVFQRDLENVFKIRRSTVSKTVELMEQKHLLERVSVDGDARKKKLRLTAEADAVLSNVRKSVEELEERVRASFCAEDYDTLMQLLGQLCTFLDRPENFEEENI
jgi:DNA-binding MarR family transcriptional regulator